MSEFKEEYICYEDPRIYDGWILQFHPETKDIIWRDFYVTNRITKEKKLEIENEVITMLNNIKND
jgi:hypothetical protein